MCAAGWPGLPHRIYKRSWRVQPLFHAFITSGQCHLLSIQIDLLYIQVLLCRTSDARLVQRGHTIDFMSPVMHPKLSTATHHPCSQVPVACIRPLLDRHALVLSSAIVIPRKAFRPFVHAHFLRCSSYRPHAALLSATARASLSSRIQSCLPRDSVLAHHAPHLLRRIRGHVAGNPG